MRPSKHFRLRVLNRLSLDQVVVDVVTPIAIRPRPLAILTLLAMSDRPVRRESLVAMFWGEEPGAKARHLLSTALSSLRAALGATAIAARRDVIELSPDFRLAVDAIEFAAACEARDDARAAQLYTGAFLDDAVLDAPEFDRWAARERNRLERLFLSLCERRVPVLLREREWDACATLAELWLRTAPQSTLAFTSLLRARSGPGTPAAARLALADYRHLRPWLASEHGIKPPQAVQEVVAELEERAANEEQPIGRELPRIPTAAEPAVVTRRPLWRRRGVRLGAGAFAAIAVIAVTAGALRARSASGARTPPHPVIAITDVANLRGDTAAAWLETALPQLMSDALSAGGTVEPVAPSRVRDVVVRRTGDHQRILTADEALDVAQRLGASWVVRGGVTAGSAHGTYVLDVDVRDVASGGDVESFTVTADDPVKLAQLAAARVLDAAMSQPGASGSAPRFAAATTEPEAYRHFVLALRAASERRSADDERRELDAAIALDSGFVSALIARRDLARGADDDRPTAQRLDALIAAHADRMSTWERMTADVDQAQMNAEVARSEALAARLVEHYPRDPRAYEVFASVLETHGRWQAADSVEQRELALDSLAMAAGDGPCAPCGAYARLVLTRLNSGNLPGAEAAARRWVSLQPGIPGSWDMLATALEFEGNLDEAIDAARRTVLLTNEPERIGALGRALLIARRFGEVDSLIATLRARGGSATSVAIDLSATIARERGQFHRAAALLADSVRAPGLVLIEADNLMRIGRIAEARRWYEASGHAGAPRLADEFAPAQARAFAWAHALEADALWRAGDTAAVQVLADSVRIVGARSYYGRDWLLYHHLNGLLALTRGDTARAERELTASQWGIAGWTSSLATLARVQLAHGDAGAALGTLRNAYKSPLDAMGRYVTRTELDDLMSQVWSRLGRADSARVYAARVRIAWRDADDAPGRAAR